MKHIRTSLITGLVVWLPLLITWAVMKFLVNLMDRTLLLLPAAYRPEALLGFYIPGLGILLALAVLIVTGVLAANLIGRRLVSGWDRLLHRIPVVRSVYSASKKLTEVLFQETNQSFKKVVMVQFRPGLWALGFQTQTNMGEMAWRSGQDLVAVFLPTTPNPTTGLLFLVPAADVLPLEMDVEAGLKLIMSLGILVPPFTAPAHWTPVAKGDPAP